LKPTDIDLFFEDLSRRVTRPLQILLTGGAAAILQGTSRATFDIDFELRLAKGGDWDLVQRAIEETSTATGIAAQYSDDIDQWSSIALPDKKSRLYRRFGKIEVRILAPALWAIGKLARYLSSDIHDLRIVLRAADTRPQSTVKVWGTALGISPLSSSQATFRKQVENFIEQNAKAIWGTDTDPEKLKRIFLETSKKTRESATRR
jgi:hypothetical protein